jgi:hypothetical protein
MVPGTLTARPANGDLSAQSRAVRRLKRNLGFEPVDVSPWDPNRPTMYEVNSDQIADRRLQRLLAAMVLLLTVRFLATTAYRAAVSPSGLSGIDVRIIRDAAARLERQEPLYLPEETTGPGVVLKSQFTCSPLIPILVRPLTRLPDERAASAWAAAEVGLLLLGMALFCWAAGVHPLDAPASTLLVLFTGFRFWPTVIELAFGNTHILLLTFTCGMLVCSRYQKWLLFAVLVALAALVKTWMLGMIFPLMVVRRWREAGTALALFLGGLAALFTVTGWNELPGFLAVTGAYATQSFLVSNSVAGMAGLFFADNAHMPAPFKNVWAWRAAMVGGYGVLVVGLAAMFVRGPRLRPVPLQLCVATSAVALILGTPVSHIYYFVIALPLLWMLLCVPPGAARPVVVPAIAFLTYLALSVPSPSMSPIPDGNRTGLNSLLVMLTFAPTLVLWLLGVGIAWGRGHGRLGAAPIAGA